jgi:hypothetical protein
MSMKTLKKALKGKNEDTFEVGDVIRWTAAGRYTYVAVKTGIGWFTTANEYNEFVDRFYKNLDDLLLVLTRSEVTDVAVSTEWTSV